MWTKLTAFAAAALVTCKVGYNKLGRWNEKKLEEANKQAEEANKQATELEKLEEAFFHRTREPLRELDYFGEAKAKTAKDMAAKYDEVRHRMPLNMARRGAADHTGNGGSGENRRLLESSQPHHQACFTCLAEQLDGVEKKANSP